MTTQELIEQTKRLIRIPSTADNLPALTEAVAFVENIVRDVSGITIEKFERNGKPSFLAYRGTKRPEKFDVLLNGHVDVVPGKPELFEPREENGRLYGRGALDMKGTALSLTSAFCEAVNKVPYSLGLQIVCDEEVGGYDGARHQIDQGVRAHFVIMGEYANDRHTIYNAARGLCWAEIVLKGKSAHGGHLWHGDNAVLKAGNFVAAVLERYPTPDKETWTTTASVASLATSNDAYNKVPDSATLKIDFRFTQEDPVFTNRKTLEKFIKSIDPSAVLVDTATFEPAVNVATLNPYVQGLNAALQQATGKETQFLGRPAGSDGRHFALVQNDIVEFGLYGEGQHSNDEYVELASFKEHQQVLKTFLHKPLLHDITKPSPMDELIAKLERGKSPEHVWFVSYGADLSKENFARQVTGGKSGGVDHVYKGTTDKTLPVRDEFISIPYELSFVGECIPCAGGHVAISKTPMRNARTIARAHMITVEQFKEMIPEQNGRYGSEELPFRQAIQHGHATIHEGKGKYDELVFCGLKDDMPMFAVTHPNPLGPKQTPSPGYMRMLCIGLSEDKQLSTKEAVEYMLHTPGITGTYKKKDVADLFKPPKVSEKNEQPLVR